MEAIGVEMEATSREGPRPLFCSIWAMVGAHLGVSDYSDVKIEQLSVTALHIILEPHIFLPPHQPCHPPPLTRACFMVGIAYLYYLVVRGIPKAFWGLV